MRRQVLIITVMTLFGSAISFASNIFMARKYGLSGHYDAYLYSLSLPIFLSTIVNSVLMFAVVPRLILDEKTDEKIKRHRLLLFTFLLSLPFLILAFFPTFFATRYLADIKSGNFNQNHLISASWVIGFAQVNLAGLNSILNANKNYFLSNLMNYFPSLGVIVFVCLDYYFGLGILAPLIGMLLGLAISIFFILKKLEIKFTYFRQISYQSAFDLVENPGNFIATIIAMNVFSMYSVIDAYLAPSFGESYLSVLGYSQRIIIGFGNIVVIGLLTVMGASFSETYKKGGSQLLYLETKKIFYTLLAITSVLAILLFVNIELVLNLIFSQKHLYENNKTLLIRLNHCMLPGMISMLISSVLLRAVFLFKNITMLLLMIGIGWPLIYILIIESCRDLGIISFGVGYSLAWIYTLTVISVFLRSRSLDK